MPLPQPDKCREAGCPLYGTSHGFVADEGDHRTAKLTLVTDVPFRSEVTAFVEPDELARRRAAYPDVPVSILSRGRPIAEGAGELFGQALRPLGLTQRDVYVMSVIRCCGDMTDPKKAYPTGDVRKKAEATCRMWDRHVQPDILVSNFRPVDLVGDITPLPLQVRAFEKAKDFVAQGHKVAVLCGPRAVKAFVGFHENVNRFVGDYTWNTDELRMSQAERWEHGRSLTIRVKGERVERRKKLTVRTALATLLATVVPDSEGNYTVVKLLTQSEFDEMRALLAVKPKKEKVPE